MGTPPNELYTVLSFIGFVLCAIPFYWHLEAWNAGTCLFMAWTGLGCLIQSINSIVWNKNVIDKAPVYCDISSRIQVALNVAVPACTLCITHRLFKIATAKAIMPTGAKKRRAVMTDLCIGLGIPILQMILQYVVSGRRYLLFEDFGPYPATVGMLPSFFLVLAWPIAISVISFVYGVRATYAFYKRRQQLKEIMSCNPGLNRGRYFRLMALSSIDIFATIPLATYYMVNDVKRGVRPWISWEDTHSYYSRVIPVPALIWKNDPDVAQVLEMYRWSLVLCAFVFFAFFGFADETRQHYRRVFTSLVRRIGYPTSFGTFSGSSHANSSLPHMKSKVGVTVHKVAGSGDRRNTSVSFSDQLSIPSTPTIHDLVVDFKTEPILPLDSVGLSSVDSFEPKPRVQPPQPAVTIPTAPSRSASVLPGTTESTIYEYSNEAVDTV